MKTKTREWNHLARKAMALSVEKEDKVRRICKGVNKKAMMTMMSFELN